MQHLPSMRVLCQYTPGLVRGWVGGVGWGCQRGTSTFKSRAALHGMQTMCPVESQIQVVRTCELSALLIANLMLKLIADDRVLTMREWLQQRLH